MRSHVNFDLDLREMGPIAEREPGVLLLDVGAGRGWPGSLLAQSSGCRLTCTDVPVSGLMAAKSILAGLRFTNDDLERDIRVRAFAGTPASNVGSLPRTGEVKDAIGTDGSRGPAIRTSPRRRVTPVASNRASASATRSCRNR